MLELSSLIQKVEPSPTLKASARAKELQSAGRDVISLTVGEPDLDTPAHVKKAALEALEKGHTKYTAVAGIPALREELSKKYKRDQGLEYKPNEIIVTNGGKQALATAFAVLLNPGDEVIIPAPYWTSFPDMAKLVGGVPVFVQTEPSSGYLLTPEALEKVITPRTRIIVLNSPSNPTGGCYTAQEFKELANVIKNSPYRDKITVVADEVYEYITYDGFTHESFAKVAPELRDNIVLTNAFSKSYSMTGWRVGYAAGPKKIIDAMETHQSQFTSNVCSIAQYGALAAYSDNYAFPLMMREQFASRIEMVCKAIEQTDGIYLAAKPKGAFFAFIRIEPILGKKSGSQIIKTSQDFSEYLLEKYNVAVVHGEAFGGPGAFRLSFALSEELLKKGLVRIQEAVRALE